MLLTPFGGNHRFYPDFIGKRAAFVGIGTGPISYSQTAGDVLSISQTPLYIDSVAGEVESLSGNYFVRPRPVGIGPRQSWTLHWYYTGSVGQGVDGATVTLGSAPTNGTYTITATTGTGQMQVVVAGAAVTSVKITIPGNYAVLPTFTPPAGLGTGASITATLGAVGGIEVGPTVNLSAEQVVISCYVGQF